MSMPVTGKRVITLCGAQGCCPTVEIAENGDVEIKDDFGGKVKLTKPQWDELQKMDSGTQSP